MLTMVLLGMSPSFAQKERPEERGRGQNLGYWNAEICGPSLRTGRLQIVGKSEVNANWVSDLRAGEKLILDLSFDYDTKEAIRDLKDYNWAKTVHLRLIPGGQVTAEKNLKSEKLDDQPWITVVFDSVDDDGVYVVKSIKIVKPPLGGLNWPG